MRLKACLGISLLLGAFSAAAQQPQARLAGLEHNAEYMSLLRDDAVLSHGLDSLANVVAGLRDKLADDDGKRNERTAEILKIESEIYTVRNNRARLAERINAIEQEWIMFNMSSARATESRHRQTDVETAADALKDAPRYADLVRNAWFAVSLSRNEYRTLVKAQSNERVAARLYADFVATYGRLKGLQSAYDAASTEAEADALMSAFTEAQAECTTISDSLAAVWSDTFDNKIYIYDLLLDKNERDDMLSKAERNMFEARRNISEAAGLYASDAIADYYYQKLCLTDYEIDIATVAELDKAADSLRAVRAASGRLPYKFGKVHLTRRYFLDYEPLRFSSDYIYTAKNPIPKCAVYEHGDIYRIKLGEFSAKQPVSKFRGLEPVSYSRAENGNWRYYAGGYASLEELEKPLQTVRRLGFRSADAVAWIDGAYADSRTEIAELKSKEFVIEISGTDVLSDDIRGVITRDAAEGALSRVGKGLFVVGGFRSRESAEMLAKNISAFDNSLSVKVVEQ